MIQFFFRGRFRGGQRGQPPTPKFKDKKLRLKCELTCQSIKIILHTHSIHLNLKFMQAQGRCLPIVAPCLTPQFMLFTLPFHQIVIHIHLTVVHYFYFIFEQNHTLNENYHIFEVLQSCEMKSLNNIENLAAFREGGGGCPIHWARTLRRISSP